MLPALVVGALWKWLFATEYGVINFALAALRLIDAPVHWLSDPALALTSVTHRQYLVRHAVQHDPDRGGARPASRRSSTRRPSLDGAGPVARFRYVTLPALKPTLLAVACLVTIYTMRAFDLIFAMTHGGPLDSSNVLPLLSYQFSFQQFHFGRRRGGRHVRVRHRLRGRAASTCAR